ncbi:MAG: radical SAM family heme chaperone HemW [Pseudomonadales bacterium]|nr:radical SAM family heme chaperone HemW [Pseudomonadales bacterium]
MLEYPPLSLYLHIPWCVRKCPYCDFNSHQVRDDLPEDEYVAALCDDLSFEASNRNSDDHRQLRSIFIGGGTPSLFSAQSIATVLNKAEQLFGFEESIEITLEANPGTAEANRFKDYYSCGVNRLSLGIQSFQESKLQVLGRIHNAQEARQAIEMCRQAGFDNFNLDLMHSLPDQSVADALEDIEQALGFEPTHLSWYQLTIEPNTEFHSRPPTLPAESLYLEIQEEGIQRLSANGFQRYEVSAYCQTEFASRHNLNYWGYGDYLGVGAGAHGKLSNPAQNAIIRSRKKKQPDHYIAAGINRDAERTEVDKSERPFEFLLNALRLRDGFDIKSFEKRTGVTFSSIGKQVEYLSAQDLLAVNGNNVTTTDRGYRVLNSLLEEFLETD